MKLMTTAIATLLISASASLAHAKVLRVPAKYGTVEEAIAASNPGDEVLISAGRYDETLLVEASGIRIVGKGKVTLSGINVRRTSDVTVENITFSSHVWTHDSTRIVLRRLKVITPETHWGMLLRRTDGLLVEECLVKSGYSSVVIDASRVIFRNNKVTRPDGEGGRVALEACYGSMVTGNTLTNVKLDIYGAPVGGTSAHLIEGNRLSMTRNSSVPGIMVRDLAGCQVRDNRISGATYGIELASGGHTVSGNRIQKARNASFKLSSTGNLLADNMSKKSALDLLDADQESNTYMMNEFRSAE